MAASNFRYVPITTKVNVGNMLPGCDVIKRNSIGTYPGEVEGDAHSPLGGCGPLSAEGLAGCWPLQAEGPQ